MKLLYLLLIFGLCGCALANNNAESEDVRSDEPKEVESDRQGRAMGEDDDFYADFDEFIRYFQRGIMKFINKMTGLQERQSLGETIPATLNQIQRGIRRFINRMTSPEERQGAGLTSTIPFIGRLIFRSLSYLGSFLVGALAVPPLLAGNALSLFGLYQPNQPNDLIASPVLPTLQFNSLTNRDSNVGSSGASSQKINDLSEALFLLGQKTTANQAEAQQTEALVQQAAGNTPVEISEIVNDLIRVQSNNRPTRFWDRLTNGLSVFLPQVSRQVTPVGALGSLLFLGTLLGAPYFLNRRSDSAGLLGDDEFNDESNDSLENYYMQPPKENYGPSGYDSAKPARKRKDDSSHVAYGAGAGAHQQQVLAYSAADQAAAYSAAEQAYAAPAPGDHNEIYAQPPGAAAAATAAAAFSPYQYVNRRQGETLMLGSNRQSDKAPAAAAAAA